MTLDKLYDQVVRQHNNEPYHFDKRPEASIRIEAYNFICGDRFEIFLDLEQDNIVNAFFYGIGCAVSKASTSVLVKNLEGKDKSEAIAMIEQFLKILENQNLSESVVSEEFNSFRVVKEVPARYDCAALGWIETKAKLIN